jgi:FkbM family methyltransferase
MNNIRYLIHRLAGGLQWRWKAARVSRMLENPSDYFAAQRGQPTGAPLRLRGGIQLFYGREDIPDYLFDELFLHDVYGMHSFYRPRSGDVILDIGGNIGWFALLCRWKAGGPIRLHSFEPDPETRGRFLHNMEANGFMGEFAVHPFAVSNRSGPAAFIRATQPLCRGLGQGGDLEVECITLATAFKLSGNPARIDLLKIDIEGGEVEAIGGAGAETLAPVLRVVMEWHDRIRPGCLSACKAALAAAGFTNVRLVYEDSRRDMGMLWACRPNLRSYSK